ncbi:Alpha/Beta hydrolase protein [Paraphysoderma sedebokerense]|nr:Alpha/Beta hydrolase protein [Paraphysoderma sedebokerense]
MNSKVLQDPTDPNSYNHRFAAVNGIRLHYVDEGDPEASTVLVLVHGFPDIWYCYRHLVYHLLRNSKQSLRIIIPSVRGYGLSDFPYVPITDEVGLNQYSAKTLCTDLQELVTQVIPNRQKKKIIWVGHDWGSYLVWRMCLYFPELVDGVASFCVPYSPPHEKYISPRDMVKLVPNFAYQLWFSESDKVEWLFDNHVDFIIHLMFRPAHDPVPTHLFSEIGRLLDPNSDDPDVKRLMSNCLLNEKEKDYYRYCLNRTGFHGGLNCYRVRKINWADELQFAKAPEGKILKMPTLMVTVGKDPAFPPTMGRNMTRFVKNLTMKHIEDASHWVQQEKPEELSALLLDWLDKVIWNASEKAKL